jgi:hypothetical protein
LAPRSHSGGSADPARAIARIERHLALALAAIAARGEEGLSSPLLSEWVAELQDRLRRLRAGTVIDLQNDPSDQRSASHAGDQSSWRSISERLAAEAAEREGSPAALSASVGPRSRSAAAASGSSAERFRPSYVNKWG